MPSLRYAGSQEPILYLQVYRASESEGDAPSGEEKISWSKSSFAFQSRGEETMEALIHSFLEQHAGSVEDVFSISKGEEGGSTWSLKSTVSATSDGQMLRRSALRRSRIEDVVSVAGEFARNCHRIVRCNVPRITRPYPPPCCRRSAVHGSSDV